MCGFLLFIKIIILASRHKYIVVLVKFFSIIIRHVKLNITIYLFCLQVKLTCIYIYIYIKNIYI
jgi:hypothetical protein